MTIDEAVTGFDLLYPNAMSYEHKLELLSRLDKRIFDEVYAKYEGCQPERFDGYSRFTPVTTPLLALFPYDDIYVKYLSMHYDLLNGDIARYNNSARVFNTALAELSAAYNRTHRWKKTVRAGDVL